MDHLKLTLRHARHDDPTVFAVSVFGKGMPAFHVRAGNMNAAISALADFVYDELDGREDIVDDDSLEA